MTDPNVPTRETSLKIDWRGLSSDALQGVLEDLVTRQEPDETPVELRCRQLKRSLEKGLVHLYYDPKEETVFLVPAAK